MAHVSQGILGGFSGTVGTVIGGHWRGIDYMRSKPIRRKSYQPTQKQIDQYNKFKLATGFAKTLAGLVDFSFKDYAVKKTGRNCCVSHILKHAITGTSPHFAINYSQVLVSQGELEPAKNAAAASAVAGQLTFTWTNNTVDGRLAKATDRAIVVAYCPALHQTMYSTTGSSRSGGLQVLDVSRFSGQDVHTYLGFISEDCELVATSVYSGVVTIM